jgi:hypothetical protein
MSHGVMEGADPKRDDERTYCDPKKMYVLRVNGSDKQTDNADRQHRYSPLQRPPRSFYFYQHGHFS